MAEEEEVEDDATRTGTNVQSSLFTQEICSIRHCV